MHTTNYLSDIRNNFIDNTYRKSILNDSEVLDNIHTINIVGFNCRSVQLIYVMQTLIVWQLAIIFLNIGIYRSIVNEDFFISQIRMIR